MRTADELFQLPFSARGIDRAGERRRDHEFLAAALAAPTSRLLVLHDGSTVPVDEANQLVWNSPSGYPAAELTFLGLDSSGDALFSTAGGAPEGDRPDGAHYAALRDVGPTFSEEEQAATVEAVALLTWHERHPFCARCGSPTRIADAGHVRHCDACGTDHFPRTDPAVIMLVTDGEDRCVLGRRIGAAEGRWSTLAGFVEPGESPEVAVAREVQEEVGLDVLAVTYRGAQPWPFPSSLMLAYDAVAGYQSLGLNDEHHEVRWFTRDEVSAGLAGQWLTLPGPVSAGRALIRSWLGEGV